MSIVSIHDFYPDGNVRTDPQHLSDRQKEQARQNIGAMSADSGGMIASAIHVTKAGKMISADMVSPMEHEVTCKVSGVPDPGKVRMMRFGKNLFDISGPHAPQTATYEYVISLPPNIDVTVSTDAPHYNDTAAMASLYVNGQSSYTNGCWIHHPKTVNTGEKGKIMLLVRFIAQDGSYDLYSQVMRGTNFIQVEAGTQATAFEPYKGEEQYIPEPDGTVRGMTSISPSMTILVDSPGVTIEAGYYADTKAYIDCEMDKIRHAMVGTV